MDKKIIERIENELSKIDNKTNNIFFFVIDTKGTPSGSLEYIYKMAYEVKENGYNVTMLYQLGKDDTFVGVGDWLDEKYSSIPHANISSDEVSVSPSDILFIPEIFANIMSQTKKLPCKRVAILQNFDYMIEQMPFSVQWGDLGILECITNTNANKKLLQDVFPYVKTTVISPYIDEMFGTTSEPKKMIINIVSKNQSDINRIIKPFYWKNPNLKWVSFREIRDLKKEEFANALREAAVTVYVDDNASFGYTALEAIKSGNIVIAKTTTNTMDWAETNGDINDAVIWFDNFNEAHHMIASVVRAWITDKVPAKIENDGKNVLKDYNHEKFTANVMSFVTDLVKNRRAEIQNLLNETNTKE